MSLSERPSEHAIHEILSHFPHERAELLPALDELNSQLGYLAPRGHRVRRAAFWRAAPGRLRRGDVLLDVEGRRQAGRGRAPVRRWPLPRDGRGRRAPRAGKGRRRGQAHQLHRPMRVRAGGRDRTASCTGTSPRLASGPSWPAKNPSRSRWPTRSSASSWTIPRTRCCATSARSTPRRWTRPWRRARTRRCARRWR